MAQMAPLKYREQLQVKPPSFKSLHVALLRQGSIEQVTAARSTVAVSVDFNERAREVRIKHRASITTPARTTAYTHASIQTGTQTLYSMKQRRVSNGKNGCTLKVLLTPLSLFSSWECYQWNETVGTQNVK